MPGTNLINRLRSLTRSEHDDLSIGDEAADEIERLHAELAAEREKGRMPEANPDAGGKAESMW